MSASGGKIELGTKISVAPSSGRCSQVNSSVGWPPDDRRVDEPERERRAGGVPGIGARPEVGSNRALGIENAEVFGVPAVLVALVPAGRIAPLGARGQICVHPVVDRGDVVARVRGFGRDAKLAQKQRGVPLLGGRGHGAEGAVHSQRHAVPARQGDREGTIIVRCIGDVAVIGPGQLGGDAAVGRDVPFEKHDGPGMLGADDLGGIAVERGQSPGARRPRARSRGRNRSHRESGRSRRRFVPPSAGIACERRGYWRRSHQTTCELSGRSPSRRPSACTWPCCRDSRPSREATPPSEGIHPRRLATHDARSRLDGYR